MYTVAHIAARAARASTSSCRPPLVTAAAATRPTTRSFASTTYRRASEVPKDPMADPQIQQFYEKLRNHQGAVDAMMKLAELMKSKGIDTTQPPSKMQMLKLGFDKDIREAGQNLVEQMKQAGVEMNPDMLKALYGRMKE